MLVGAHLFALVLNPGTHGNSLADDGGVESVTTAVAAVAVVIPFTVRIGVADCFTLVHVEALLRALFLEVDEAHVVEFAGVLSVGPAVGTAFGFFSRPHASVLGVTFGLSVVSNLATSRAGEVSAVPSTESVTETVFSAEDVGALQRALFLGLETVDTESVGLAGGLINVVGAGAFADFSEGIPLTFSIREAGTTSRVTTERADEVADRSAFGLPVALGHGFADFAAVEDGTLFRADAVDVIPHAVFISLTIDTAIPESLAALDALLERSLSGVPEAELITTAESFSGVTRGLFVGRARLDASGGVVVPLAVGIVVTGEVGADTEIAVLADESTGADVELPFADRAGETSTLRFDEAASTSAEVVGVVPGAVIIGDASFFGGVDVLTLLGAGIVIDDAHGVGDAGSSIFIFSSGVASAGLGADFRLEIPHAVGVVVAGGDSGVGETTLLAASHGVVTVGVLGLVEEERPVTAGVSFTGVVVEVVTLELALILSSHFAHNLSNTIVSGGSEFALAGADVVVDVPHAARISDATSLVGGTILELAGSLASADGGVPIAETTKFAISTGSELGTVLAAHFEVRIPHAERILGAVGGSRMLADRNTLSAFPVAEVVSFAHFSHVDGGNTRDLGVTIAAVAAVADLELPFASRIGIAVDIVVVLVLTALSTSVQSPFAHSIGVAARLVEDESTER